MERKRLLPVLPLMEKTKRQKVQANLQSIMIIWAKLKSNRIMFPSTSLVQQPFWLSQGWILRVAAWKLKLPPDDVNQEMKGYLSVSAGGLLGPFSISIKKFFQLNLKLKLFFFSCKFSGTVTASSFVQFEDVLYLLKQPI